MVVNSGIAERVSVILLSTLLMRSIRHASSAIVWIRCLPSTGKAAALTAHTMHKLLYANDAVAARKRRAELLRAALSGCDYTPAIRWRSSAKRVGGRFSIFFVPPAVKIVIR